MINISAFEKAIEQLQESLTYTQSELALNNKGLAKQFRSSSIQAFEYTYELACKMLKRYLENTEPSSIIINEMSFQDLIRTGAEKGLLLNSWDKWKNYRQSRNLTSQTYNEAKAEEIFQDLPNFLTEAEFLRDQINQRQNKK